MALFVKFRQPRKPGGLMNLAVCSSVAIFPTRAKLHRNEPVCITALLTTHQAAKRPITIKKTEKSANEYSENLQHYDTAGT